MTVRRVRERASPATPPGEGPLLLDSHVWLWYLVPSLRPLASTTVTLIDGARERGEAFVSHVTPWELTWKASAGLLHLSKPPRVWMDDALARSGFSELGLTLDILLDAASMASYAPRDPMDRLLISSARRHGCTLLTADTAVLDWARRTRAVRVLRAK